MSNIEAKEAMKELTMILMYLSHFTEKDGFSNTEHYHAWKGYNFEIINELDDADYIRQGKHPSRTKSVFLTDTGIELAKNLLTKYGIDDWK